MVAMVTILFTVYCKLFHMMPYIIMLKVRKFHQTTASRFSTARKKPVGGAHCAPPPPSLNRVNEYIHSFVTEKPSDAFFFNRKHLKEFNRKVEMLEREDVPGYFYAMKITNSIELHYRADELYIEFIKDGFMEKRETVFLVQRDQMDWA